MMKSEYHHDSFVANMILVGLFLLLLLALLSITSRSQDKPESKSLTPTETQAMRLQIKQKDAIIAQQNVQLAQQALQAAQARFQQSIADLDAEAERVKKEQGWPEATGFDHDTLRFTPAPIVTPAPARSK